MALPILDGNQTSTTLATTVLGGAHYPNHIIASGTVTIGNFGDQITSLWADNAVNDIGLAVNNGIGTYIDNFGNFPISGTVEANLNNASFDGNGNLLVCVGSALPTGTNRIGVVTIGGGTVTIGAGTAQIGSVTASISNSVTIASLPAISGTVTANNPNGTLTTRFGSVTTANTAQITTAVTNTSRKYLLCQNNQTGTSAGTVTIGIGFTPTTTQGIQLISGASYTADSYVPTGAVYWLGAVTGANFTILEG
jgi:hypothetical protein